MLEFCDIFLKDKYNIFPLIKPLQFKNMFQSDLNVNLIQKGF